MQKLYILLHIRGGGGDSHANTKYFFGGLTLVTGDTLDEKLSNQLLLGGKVLAEPLDFLLVQC